MRVHSRLLGYSLIELMIVITIIGILATIAIPSYRLYTQRARFAEIVTIADAYKTAVSLALQAGASMTDVTNNKYGIPDAPSSTKNLATLKVEDGQITATATALLNNATYILTPNADGSIWTVSGSCLTMGLCND